MHTDKLGNTKTPPQTVHMDQAEFINIYQQMSQQFAKDVRIPSLREIHGSVMALPDTAAGYGGIPYAFWRLISVETSMMIRSVLMLLLLAPFEIASKVQQRTLINVWIGTLISLSFPLK